MDNFKLEGGSKVPRTTPTLEDQHALARSKAIERKEFIQ